MLFANEYKLGFVEDHCLATRSCLSAVAISNLLISYGQAEAQEKILSAVSAKSPESLRLESISLERKG